MSDSVKIKYIATLMQLSLPLCDKLLLYFLLFKGTFFFLPKIGVNIYIWNQWCIMTSANNWMHSCKQRILDIFILETCKLAGQRHNCPPFWNYSHHQGTNSTSTFSLWASAEMLEEKVSERRFLIHGGYCGCNTCLKQGAARMRYSFEGSTQFHWG